MKQIDYLKLVSTGKRSTYFARASEEDEALMYRGIDGHWLIYLPPLAFLIVVCWVTFRQVSLLR